jgi:hypothetical protein
VARALHEHPDTASIPILVLTAKQVTGEDRAALNGHVVAIMDKVECDQDRFGTELRRAASNRPRVA